MISSKGYAAQTSTAPLAPFSFERRDLLDNDIFIEILYCGICHSDIHQVRNEWNKSKYPLVPGHEIIGRVLEVGKNVTKYQKNDLAAVGCFVNSCHDCNACNQNLEQYCQNGWTPTYNGIDPVDNLPTYGGYSNNIIVNQSFALKINNSFANSDKLANIAPLLCAGITTYSPLKYWNITSGNKVGVIGLGGLGHMAIKLASSFGADVTLFTTSDHKKTDALKFGAKNVVISTDRMQLEGYQDYFDLILNTVSAPIDYNIYLNLLRQDGTMVLLGIPEKPCAVSASSLIHKRRNLSGSLVGGIAETQEMLDYCINNNIYSEVEIIAVNEINSAYERMLKSDVKYRFVIDMSTL